MNEKYGIGQSVSRFEDPRLLRGEGRFINDMVVPGMAHIAYVRSPHARARIVSIDPAAALAAPGVLGVFTIDDLERDGVGTTAPTLKRSRPGRQAGVLARAPGPGQGDGAPCRRPGRHRRRGNAGAGEGRRRAASRWTTRRCPSPTRCGTNVPTTSATCSRSATAPRRKPRSPRPRTSSSGATRCRACTPSSWSRAARSANGIAGTGRYTLHCDVQYPHRVREILAGVLKVRRTAGPRRQPGRRRRVRRQGLGAPGAPARAVARAQARPPGEMDLRPQRVPARGRARARPRHRDRARVRRRPPHPRAARAQHQRARRLRLHRPQPAARASSTSARWRACT